MVIEPVFKYGLPLLTMLVVGLLGKTRRVGFWGAIIASVFLTPLGGFLVALISGARPINDEVVAKPLPTSAGEGKKRQWFSFGRER